MLRNRSLSCSLDIGCRKSFLNNWGAFQSGRLAFIIPDWHGINGFDLFNTTIAAASVIGFQWSRYLRVCVVPEVE
jgi:hypothetical protein